MALGEGDLGAVVVSCPICNNTPGIIGERSDWEHHPGSRTCKLNVEQTTIRKKFGLVAISCPALAAEPHTKRNATLSILKTLKLRHRIVPSKVLPRQPWICVAPETAALVEAICAAPLHFSVYMTAPGVARQIVGKPGWRKTMMAFDALRRLGAEEQNLDAALLPLMSLAQQKQVRVLEEADRELRQLVDELAGSSS